MAKIKSKVFSFLRVYDGSVIPSIRIARMVADELKAPLVDDRTMNDEAVDVLYIVNGAYAFCRCLETLGTAIGRARRVVWIQNDYTIIPPKKEGEAESPFRKAFRDRFSAGKPDTDFWTTCEDLAKATPGSTYINWNALSMDNATINTIKQRRRTATETLLYYGSFRANRVKYFDRYFGRPEVKVIVSAPSNKFVAKYPGVEHRSKIDSDFYQFIGSFGAGLYLEDRLSHSHFHSPANRFYEMLSAGLPIIFQPECGSMMRKAGYDPTPYQASSPVEIKRMLAMREDIGAGQRTDWLEKARVENAGIPGKIKIAAQKLEK